MNENEVEVNQEKDFDSDALAGEVVDEDVLDDSELSDILLPDSDDSSRDFHDDVSSGDIGQAFGTVSSGDSESDEYVSSGDAGIDTDISNTQFTSETLVADSAVDMLSLEEKIDTINTTLVLILFFLLFDWTAKKISLSVRKFSGEGRKN